MENKLLSRIVMLSKFVFYGLVIQVFAISMLFAMESDAQSYTSVRDLRLDLNLRNASLEEIFTAIERKTDYKFSYDRRILKSDVRMDLRGRNEMVYNYLLKVSKEASLQFKQINNFISVKEVERTLPENHRVTIITQQITISGKVTSGEDNSALPGVNVIVKGTNRGTVTDIDGNYQIEVPSSETVLVFSSIGFVTEEITVGQQSVIDVILTSDVTALEEIVVVGYGEQKREVITGAIGNVTADELTRTPAVTTSGALVGRIQGITARRGDARPGAPTSIQIRNLGVPLYVIDGIPSDEGQFNNLGPNDIESISILKDDAAAIYGLRAANGVVLVTTKKGKRGEKANINLSGYYGLQNFTRYPRPANAYQYLRARVESEINLGRTAPADIPPEELQKWREGTEPGYQSFDYYDFVIRPNVPQYYFNGSAKGGTENASYFVSVSHLNQDALIKDYNFNRTNFQANMDISLSEGLSIGAQLSGRIEDRHQVGVPGLDDYFNPFLSIFSMWPTERPYANDNPNYVNNTHNVNVNPATYTEEITGYIDDIWRSFRGNFFAEYEFDFGLKLRGVYSYTFANLDFDGFEYTYDAFTYNEATDTYEVTGGNQNPWRERRREDLIDNVGQFQISYNKEFGDHSISALVGVERFDHSRHYQVVHTVPPNNYIPIMSFNDQDLLIDELGEEARMGYIGRFNYSYKDKYLVEALGRYDGSFLFPAGNRFGFFPGVSLGWRITEEPFMQGIMGNFLTELKVRGSYSYTGNERLYQSNNFVIAPYSYYSGYDFLTGAGGSAVLDGNLIPGVDPRGLPVTNFSWIDNITTNIGIDFGLFQGRLFGQIDIFERRRKGLPAGRYDVQIPNEVGYSLPSENLETDAHKGIEGAISYKGRLNDISYTIGANATLSRWRYVDRYKPRYGNSWDEYRTAEEDRWARIFWGYEVVGQFQSQEEIDNYPIDNDGRGNRNQLPGDLKFKDVNDDGGLLTASAGPHRTTAEVSNTGFYLRKYVDSAPQSSTRGIRSDTWWVRFRLGEIYLNAAEAAFELEENDEALDYVNELRERAGFGGNSLTTLTFDQIRNERRVELAFEDHIVWDLKRWRIAHEVWDGDNANPEANMFALYPYRVIRPGDPARDGKYVFEKIRVPRFLAPRFFQMSNYYSEIPVGAINNNPKLVRNPFH